MSAIRQRLDDGDVVLVSPLGYSPTGEIFNLALEEVATQVAVHLSARTIRDAGHLDRELGTRLADAARQRNLLIHLYLKIDDSKVFASLGHLDDLRAFAAVVQQLVAEDERDA